MARTDLELEIEEIARDMEKMLQKEAYIKRYIA